MFNNKKMRVTKLVFKLLALKAKLRVFLTRYNVAMVASDVKEITKTYSPIIGQLFNIIIVAATEMSYDDERACCTELQISQFINDIHQK